MVFFNHPWRCVAPFGRPSKGRPRRSVGAAEAATGAIRKQAAVHKTYRCDASRLRPVPHPEWAAQRPWRAGGIVWHGRRRTGIGWISVATAFGGAVPGALRVSGLRGGYSQRARLRIQYTPLINDSVNTIMAG